MTELKKEKEENYIKQYWRPAMAWQYFCVCVFDFLLAPLITGWYAWFAKVPYEVWKPITMSESGFYHMAMGAIVGITAWTRGQEKLSRIDRLRMGLDRPDPEPEVYIEPEPEPEPEPTRRRNRRG